MEVFRDSDLLNWLMDNAKQLTICSKFVQWNEQDVLLKLGVATAIIITAISIYELLKSFLLKLSVVKIDAEVQTEAIARENKEVQTDPMNKEVFAVSVQTEAIARENKEVQTDPMNKEVFAVSVQTEAIEMLNKEVDATIVEEVTVGMLTFRKNLVKQEMVESSVMPVGSAEPAVKNEFAESDDLANSL